MNALVSPAEKYSEYRQALKLVSMPLLPLLPCHLAEIGYIHAQHKTYLESGYIHFSKMTILAETIQELLRYQKVEYALTLVEALQVYIKQCFQDGADEATRTKMSYTLEPGSYTSRKAAKTEETVSRLLKVTGMIG